MSSALKIKSNILKRIYACVFWQFHIYMWAFHHFILGCFIINGLIIHESKALDFGGEDIYLKAQNELRHTDCGFVHCFKKDRLSWTFNVFVSYHFQKWKQWPQVAVTSSSSIWVSWFKNTIQNESLWLYMCNQHDCNTQSTRLQEQPLLETDPSMRCQHRGD